ncbi:phage major capsid protein [Vibrio cholerae]|uniref:phage major capsid protein n=1 Tax=Vibrio cholerae TaxID=666 RepID=UPI001E419D3E|nr:phage major capsid protein [Vibrio cholerae]EGQ9960037.1 phage major capsid protein [Vibrio cholerae]EJL6479674.1 phage major capsid protein [Vibrio cholerae]EJL6830114.1 phage major capsid protein [Vibrio cholerae]EJL7007697.1 phage major capsid protein [Vibrio cholerae]EKF9698720.1 phage major capsid protein [Vibrio cholerae]
MDLQEIMSAVQAVAEKKDSTAADVAQVKAQLESFVTKSALEELEQKSADALAQVESLKEQILDMEAKGHFAMTTPEQKTITFKDAANAYAEALVKGLESGVTGSVAPANTQNDDQAGRLLIDAYDAGVLKPLRDTSSIMSAISIEHVANENQAKAFIQVNESDVRPSVENIAMAQLDNTKLPEYREVAPVFGKFYAQPAITREMLTDGAHISMASEIPAAVTEAFGMAATQVAHRGDGRKMKGIAGLFADKVESAKADAERIYTAAQAIEIDPAKFGVDFAYTVKALQAVRRSLATGYRSTAVWRMNEETFDLLDMLVDGNGRPLLHTNIHDAGEARLLGFSVVIDVAMPGIEAGAMPVYFGDVNRAYKMYTLNGGMFKELRSPAPEVYQFYHSLRLGERVGDTRALKALRVKTK